MVDFRKGVSVHGGGAEGDIVTLDANKEIQTSGIKIADVAKKNDITTLQVNVTTQGARIDALEASMGDTLARLAAINGEI